MRKIFVLFFTLILVGVAIVKYNSQQQIGIVRAFGPLNVTFPSTPLFSEANWKPGSSVTKTITIENADVFVHKFGIKAFNFTDSTNIKLSEVLTIIILQDGIPVYGSLTTGGSRTLKNFYNEEAIWFGKLKAKEKTNISINVSMDLSLGNEFQGTSTSFDLLVGIDDVINSLPTLPLLPSLRPLRGLPQLPTFRPLPTLGEIPTIRSIR